MEAEAVVLPFKVPNLFGGFAEGKGLARANASELTLEFVVRDNLLNVFKSSVKEIRIPRAEIDSVEFHKGWFTSKVRIRLKSLKPVAGLPDCENGEVVIHVPRRHRAQAQAFVQLLGKR